MIRIITDSTCDISKARQAELGIEIVPLTVQFGAESFKDGVDMTPKEFYDRLKTTETLPTTSQVNPDEFALRFQGHVDAGDQIVGIFLSSALSGTYQSAVIARDIVDAGEIHLVDSGTVTFALGMLVEMAVQFRDAGKSASEIATALRQLATRIRLYAVVGNLKYLKMGGRISAASAVVGSMLGITPILNVKDGLVEAAAKSRGRKGAFHWMEQQMDTVVPVDLSLPIGFAQTDAPEAFQACKDYFLAKFPGATYLESNIGCVVGTHAGPGCAGIAFFEAE